MLPVVGLLALVSSHPLESAPATERLSLRTDDGVSLAATWYEPSARPGAAVVLVHMLTRSRREWDAVAQRLASEGIGALALDLRGHGESQGGPPSRDPAQPDYSSMVLDVKAAARHLLQRADVQPSRIGIVGASIGANLATLYASSDEVVKSVVLLSPSIDYRGLRIEAAMRKIARPVLLVASDDDPYASRSARELQQLGTGAREILVLDSAGHGTRMLAEHPDLVRTLVDWFRRTLL